jgi:hypothetical protein
MNLDLNREEIEGARMRVCVCVCVCVCMCACVGACVLGGGVL